MKKIKKIYIIIPVIILTIVLTAFGIANIVNSSKQANADIDNKFADKEGQAVSDKILDGQEDVMVVPMDDEMLDNVQDVPEEAEPEQEPKEKTEKPKVEQTAKPSTTTGQKKEIKYFIKVNYTQNVVTIYTKDTNGNYTVPYKAMVCSTGKATPRSGTYTIPSGTYSRGTWGLMVGNVWAQYFTRIKGSILFHSVPYTQRNKWSLEYWEYDKLGTTASAGCVRLTVQNAKWIYDNCPAGTQVEFYSDSNPGPLGKPTAQKISSEEAVRDWDPTDPAENNPWKTYVKEEPKVEQIVPETPKEEIKTETTLEKTKEETTTEKTEIPKQETTPANPENPKPETEVEKPETTPSETIKPEDTSKEETTDSSETTKTDETQKQKNDEIKTEDTSSENETAPEETTRPVDTPKDETTTPSEVTKPNETSNEDTLEEEKESNEE